MTKIVRSTLPKDVSIGIIAIIFVLTFFLSGRLFEHNQPVFEGFINLYFGEFLVSLAVLLMVVILWEEILFPVKTKSSEEGLIFRNHRTKLWLQVILYLMIPAIVGFLYFTYAVNPFPFFFWAAVCITAPIAGKLISGINNYNDFLKLTHNHISFKNNKMEGSFELNEISNIVLVKDEGDVLHKVQLKLTNSKEVIIDLDEMELEDYYETINEYINDTYNRLLG